MAWNVYNCAFFSSIPGALVLLQSINVAASLDQDDDDEDNESDEADQQRHGEWLRRRQLDGALNRVPCEFYTKAWRVLDRVCDAGKKRHSTVSHFVCFL